MPWTYTDEYYKNYTRETWDECAERYLPLMGNLMQYHKALLERIQPRPGEKVLDVCTGPGEPAMTIAQLVAPAGRVIAIDLSERMVDIARKTAALRGLRNAEFLAMDAEELDLSADRFDLAVACFGFQIVTDPEAAAREILRVVKPGGRVGLTVWATGDRAPALHVLVGPMLEHAEPDENGYLPTPYELGGPGELAAMLRQVGFADTEESRVTGAWRAESPEAYLRTVLDGSPLGHSLKEEEPAVQEAVARKALENIRRWRSNGGVEIPAECVIVTARKP